MEGPVSWEKEAFSLGSIQAWQCHEFKEKIEKIITLRGHLQDLQKQEGVLNYAQMAATMRDDHCIELSSPGLASTTVASLSSCGMPRRVCKNPGFGHGPQRTKKCG